MLSDHFHTRPAVCEQSDNALAACGDARDLLSKLKSETVNLIFADPPYNIGKDFGDGAQVLSDEAYIEWCQVWLSECLRVLHPTGTFYFMAATQHMPHLDIFVAQRCTVLARIIWVYDSSGVQPRKKFGSLYEPLLMVVKDPQQYTFNADDIAVEAKTGAQRGLIDYRKTPPQPYNSRKLPGNVWEFPRVRYRMSEYENHPTQKPEALLKRVILASSNPGDVVLDPFGGSFTTGAVAVQQGRQAISFDINPDYFKIGLRRMGIRTEYAGETLNRDLSRKTRNKAKKDHPTHHEL